MDRSRVPMDRDEARGPTPSRAASLFILGYLLIQVLVPVVQLSKPRPAQFGWQMYSDVKTEPRLEVFTVDSTYSVDFESVVVGARTDVVYDDRLLEWLCRPSNAERVRIYREVPSRDRTFSCGR